MAQIALLDEYMDSMKASFATSKTAIIRQVSALSHVRCLDDGPIFAEQPTMISKIKGEDFMEAAKGSLCLAKI